MFALAGLLIAKENKTSEFRQAWIDALRQELAEYSTSVNRASYIEKTMLDAPSALAIEYEKILQPLLVSAGNAQMKIRLRINANDSDKELKKLNIDLLQSIQDIQSNYNHEGELEKLDEAATNARRLHEKAAPILKAEWERVKRGELIYRAAKWGSVALVVVAFVTAALLSYVLMKNGF